MKAALSKAYTEAQEIVERMCSVRNVGYDHVVALQGEAKRLIDWKEYVRAKPILFVAVASLLGFSIVRKATQVVSKSSSPTMVVGDFTKDSKSFRSTLTSSLATLATSMASNAIKSYIVNTIQCVNSEVRSAEHGF